MLNTQKYSQDTSLNPSPSLKRENRIGRDASVRVEEEEEGHHPNCLACLPWSWQRLIPVPLTQLHLTEGLDGGKHMDSGTIDSSKQKLLLLHEGKGSLVSMWITLHLHWGHISSQTMN